MDSYIESIKASAEKIQKIREARRLSGPLPQDIHNRMIALENEYVKAFENHPFVKPSCCRSHDAKEVDNCVIIKRNMNYVNALKKEINGIKEPLIEAIYEELIKEAFIKLKESQESLANQINALEQYDLA